MTDHKESHWVVLKMLPVVLLLLVACREKEMQNPQKTSTQTQTTNDIMFNETQMLLANITTGRVKVQEMGETTTVNARLVADQEKIQTVSARVQGRVEKLFMKETGRVIKIGDPLYKIYSESLLTLQREYLLAKEQFQNAQSSSSQSRSFFQAAERKLLLYGLSREQIKILGETKSIQPSFTFYSPVSGLIKSINVSEGQTVAEGESLYELENNQKLWVEAELFSTEVALVKQGSVINVKISGLDNEVIKAQVSFLSPELSSKSQVTIMRAVVNNKSGELKPGMSAEVFFTHSTTKGIAVPVNAVMRDEHGSHVYVQHGVNTFRPQQVVTGVEDGSKIEIKEGLTSEDTIAMTGAYLIYSEYVLKRGGEPIASSTHNH